MEEIIIRDFLFCFFPYYDMQMPLKMTLKLHNHLVQFINV